MLLLRLLILSNWKKKVDKINKRNNNILSIAKLLINYGSSYLGLLFNSKDILDYYNMVNILTNNFIKKIHCSNKQLINYAEQIDLFKLTMYNMINKIPYRFFHIYNDQFIKILSKCNIYLMTPICKLPRRMIWFIGYYLFI
jgi:hypothetical protein